ncbi:MAG: hypothetical protein AAFR41_07090 [Pseudomonadota bacterium]
MALKHPISIIAIVAVLAACATPEPDPCTAEWIDWKKDEIFSEFTRTYRADIRALRNLEDDLQSPSMVAALRLASRAETIGNMAEDFISETVPELRAALGPCAATPVTAADLMADLLEDQGVGEQTIAWVRALGAFIETVPPES